MKINSHILKIQGKVELPTEIETGHNYHVATEGSVNKVELHDNEDGTWNKIYTFKPVHVSLLTPKGESLKLKDPRKKSMLFKQYLFKEYANSHSTIDFDIVYDKSYDVAISMVPAIMKEVIKRLNGN